MPNHFRFLLRTTFVLVAACNISMASTSIATTTPLPLPALGIDQAQTSVSGISSGGHMAVQLHVAYSATFKAGAGVIAGGPFNCADNSVLYALTRCLGRSAIPVEDLVKQTVDWAKNGWLDAPTNLSAAKIYLFAGARDSVVPASTSRDLKAYYQHFARRENIILKEDIEAEHAMVTDHHGATCLTKATPFINNCGFDLAGAILQHLYGTLVSPTKGSPGGTLSEFDQTAYVNGRGMAPTGWIFVPAACAAVSKCRLHVVLHGCKQNTASVGQDFVRHAGYNRWADTNNIIVLYPQTGDKAINGCWDWWGYDSANHAKKSAPQMTGIINMIAALTREPVSAKKSAP